MKKITTVLLLHLFISSAVFSQHHFCGTDEAVKKAIDNNPAIQTVLQQNNDHAKQYERGGINQKTNHQYVIPVVFHIIHDYGSENVTKQHLLNAIETINKDFQKRNADTNRVVAAFKDIIANSEIEFRLAQIDPDGNCTEGITRTASQLTYIGGENVKSLVTWDTRKYLNIWVVKHIVPGGVAGYSYYPGTAPSQQQEGILMRSDHLGSSSNQVNISDSRTRVLTHEIGHFLNLAHTWGSTNNTALESNCSSDDEVGDTPGTIGSNQNCDLGQFTCGSLDNVQNHMDYSTCRRMFTEGQKLRMHAALNSTAGSRNTLWEEDNLIATGTNDGYVSLLCPPIPDFRSSSNSACLFDTNSDTVTFTGLSYNADVDSTWIWEWSFPGASPSTSNDQNPKVVYTETGEKNVSLTITNASGSNTTTKSAHIKILDLNDMDTLPFFEGFENVAFPQHPVNDLKSWRTEGFGNTWHRTVSASTSGNASLRIENLSEGNVSAIISPPIDLSNSNGTFLKFKLAYRQYDLSNADELSVWVSTNCGESWIPRYSKAGNSIVTDENQLSAIAFVPSADEWREETVNLNAFDSVQSIMVKFEMESDGGNYLYLDDIQIVNALVNNVIETDTNTTEFVKVFPNPITQKSVISVNVNEVKSLSIELYDLLGNMVAQNSSQMIDGSHQDTFLQKVDVPQGVYFLRVMLDNQSFSEKIVF